MDRQTSLENKVGRVIQANKRLRKRIILMRRKLTQKELEYASLVEINRSMAKKLNEMNFLDNVNNFNNVVRKNLEMWAPEDDKKEKNFIKYVTFMESQMSSFLKICRDLSNNIVETKTYTGTLLNSFYEKFNMPPTPSTAETDSAHSSTQQKLIPFGYQNVQIQDQFFHNGCQHLSEDRTSQAVTEPPTEQVIQDIKCQQEEADFVQNDHESEIHYFHNENEIKMSTNVGRSLLSESSPEYSESEEDMETDDQNLKATQENEIESEEKTSNFRHQLLQLFKKKLDIPEHLKFDEPSCSQQAYSQSSTFLSEASAATLREIKDDYADEEILLAFKKDDVPKEKPSQFSYSVENKLNKMQQSNEIPEEMMHEPKSEESSGEADVEQGEQNMNNYLEQTEESQTANETSESESDFILISSDNESESTLNPEKVKNLSFNELRGHSSDYKVEKFTGFTANEITSSSINLEKHKGQIYKLNVKAAPYKN